MDVGSSMPVSDIETVLQTEIKEWHFHIYFRQNNAKEQHAARELREAILKLVRMGAFVAVPLFRFNNEPTGPHTVGSYEIWVPGETFSSVFSYLVQNRGTLSILLHPLSHEPRADHDHRKAWIGDPWPLDLTVLPVRKDHVHSQYPSLKLGYNTIVPVMSMEERRNVGAHVAKVLGREELAARPTW